MNNIAKIPHPAATIDRELVRRTVAQGATDAELELYLHDCARRNVHPLDRLLHFTKRGGKYVPIVSIDLMRSRAADTGELAGSDDAVFEPANNPKLPFSATVTVYRLTQGQRFAYTATARFAEYSIPSNQNWQKMPHVMIAKCAEALALRKAFPQQLAGLYTREEMDQAALDSAPARENPHVNRPEDIIDVPPAEHSDRIPIGAADIKSLPKKDARADNTRLQAEMWACKTEAELKAWGEKNKDRIATQPKDWQEILRGHFVQALTILRNPPSDDEPEADWLTELDAAYAECKTASDMFQVDLRFSASMQPQDEERAQEIRQEHLARLEVAP